MTLPQWPIAQLALESPDDIAVIDRGTPYTFAAFDKAITHIANSLSTTSGERVGLWTPTSYTSLCLLHALLRRGAVVAPINTRLPLSHTSELVVELGLSALFVAESAPTPDIDGIPVLALPMLPHPSGLSLNETRQALPTRQTNAPAIIMLSSGSTSRPKAIVHSYASLAYNALGANANIPIQRGDRWLLSLPLYHVSGLGILFRSALAGATVVIDNAPNWAATVRTHEITHLSVVATQLARLVDAWEKDGAFLSLKAVLAGGSHIPKTLVQRACGLGMPLHLSYGSTEMGSQITTTSSGDRQEPLTTSGHLLKYREATIGDDREILVKGPTLCLGYLRGGKLESCCDADGWFHTGDSGSFDSTGQLVVTGRRDRMFISGGENIYPEEIEEALLDLPGVAHAAVIVVPDETYGARPIAFVRLHDGITLNEKALRTALATTLPTFKIPDQFLSWPSDDPNAGMKADLEFLKQRALRLLAIG